MGRNNFAKDIRVNVGSQGQRKTYYGDDNREAQQPRGGSRGGGSFNRVWRRGKKVSFHDRRGGGNRGGISKRDNRDRDGRPQFDSSRLARVLGENDEQMGGQTSSQSGRARPLPRGRGKFRGRGVPLLDRSRFVKLAPLSDDNKTKIQEAMNKRYVPGNKALDLSDFGADKTFGGSSNAIGRLTDERVMDIVIDTIAEHLSDLQALNLSNNKLRTLRVFSKIVGKARNITILYLNHNNLAHSKELDTISKLTLVELKLEGNPFIANFKDGTNYARYVRYLIYARGDGSNLKLGNPFK